MKLADLIIFLMFLFPFGAGLHAQPVDSLKNIKVTITFATPPSTFSVTKASLRFNKTFALSFQIDDGKKDVYNPGFQFLNGGTVGDSVYPGLKFTDGCGNDLKFKMTSALFSFAKQGGVFIDGHDPAGPYATTNVTWPELVEMYQAGWGVANHGLSSDIGSSLSYDIARNHSFVKLKMALACQGGPDMRMFVNPNGNDSYTQPAFDQGYLACFRGGAAFGRPSLNVTSTWNHHDIDMYRANLYGTVDLSALTDAMATASINGAHHWGVVFTHYLTNGNYGYTFPVFKGHMNYIADTYGKTGLDNLWMATEEEILEYLLIKDTLNVQTMLNDTTLEITFSGNVPPGYRFYNSTLLIDADANVSSMTTTGVSGASFNGIGTSSSMINITWNGREVVPAEVNADTWVTKTESTHSQEDADISMDYIAMVADGPAKDSLRLRLCDVTLIVLPDGYCTIVPDNLTLQNDTVFTGQTKCYNATQTITVAGNGTSFIIQEGGSATMIAGQNFLLLSGARIDSGGYLSGYITTTGEYCVTPKNSLVANPMDLTEGRAVNTKKPDTKKLNIYPNPTSGIFTIEGTEAGSNIRSVEIQSASGVKVLSEKLNNVRAHMFSISGLRPGIYFVNIMTENQVDRVKMVKL